MTVRRTWLQGTLAWCLAATSLVSPRLVLAGPVFAAPFISIDTHLSNGCVAIADLNGDGKPDLANPTSTPASVVAIFLGNGDGSFVKAGELPTDYYPLFVAIGDLNHDGRPDLVTANWYNSTVSVLLATGGGAFAPHVDFATGYHPWCVAIADLNRDGRPDLVTANYDAGSVSVLLGDGAGGFGVNVDYDSGPKTSFVAVGDLDGDGRSDLVTANAEPASVSILLGHGDGSFGAHTEYPVVEEPTSLAIADLDGDGRQDLVVANYRSSYTITIFWGEASGVLGARTDLVVRQPPASVVVADLDRDGRLDIAAAGDTDGWDPMTVMVMLGLGSRHFRENVAFAGGTAPLMIASADVNCDGRPDLVTANSGMDNSSISVLIGIGDGSFGANATYATDHYLSGVAIGDLDGDGVPDLVSADGYPDAISFFHGRGDGSFDPGIDSPLASEPSAIAIGDLDADGRLDVVIANRDLNTVSALMGNGDGTMRAGGDFATGAGPSAVAIADLDGNGTLDLVVADTGDDLGCGNTVSVLLGDGQGGFAAARNFVVGQCPDAIAIADLNGDGRPDLAVANGGSSSASVLLGLGDGTFGTHADFGTGGYPRGIACADVNGDGRPDLVTGNQNRTISILLARAGGGFGPRTDYPASGYPTWVAIAHLDADTMPDIVTTNCFSGTVTVLPGSGPLGPSVSRRMDFGTARQPNCVAIGDLNHDGRPDAAIACAGGLQVLLGTGGEPWVGVTPQSAPARDLALRAWPNPIASTMQISFSLPGPREVTLCIHDIAGRLVATVARGSFAAGTHEARWNVRSAGGKVRPGVYLVVLHAGQERRVTRLAVVR